MDDIRFLGRGDKMHVPRLLIITLLIAMLTGCYLPIKGRVIDAETGAPIEDAIVLVEWTKKHGFIDPATESFKVVETTSDKEGNVQIEGCNSPFVKPPDVTVYKKGYVAWSNRWIFPDNKERTDFRWDDYVFRLEQFRHGYSHDRHVDFIRASIHSALGNNKELIKKAFEWEIDLAIKGQ